MLTIHAAVGWDEAKRNPSYPHAMRTYLRDRTPGGCYFFTVNLADRKRHTLIEHVGALREAFRTTLADHPVRVDAIVVLPDHLHCLWQLPPDDADYPLRWRLIKARFAAQVADDVAPSESRRRRGERGVWQRRYWEHRIRDDADYARHLDYIPLQPGQARPCRHGAGLAVFLVPPMGRSRRVRRRLGRSVRAPHTSVGWDEAKRNPSLMNDDATWTAMHRGAGIARMLHPSLRTSLIPTIPAAVGWDEAKRNPSFMNDDATWKPCTAALGFRAAPSQPTGLRGPPYPRLLFACCISRAWRAMSS